MEPYTEHNQRAIAALRRQHPLHRAPTPFASSHLCHNHRNGAHQLPGTFLLRPCAPCKYLKARSHHVRTAWPRRGTFVHMQGRDRPHIQGICATKITPHNIMLPYFVYCLHHIPLAYSPCLTPYYMPNSTSREASKHANHFSLRPLSQQRHMTDGPISFIFLKNHRKETIAKRSRY
jgi:hypothetical protein